MVLSADATKTQIARFIDAGAFGHLTKPLDVAEFLGMVDRAVHDDTRTASWLPVARRAMGRVRRAARPADARHAAASGPADGALHPRSLAAWRPLLIELAPVVPLTPVHDTTAFDCGSRAQTDWLRRYALQAQSAGTSRVYVTTAAGSPVVLGYYALAAGSVEPTEAPRRLRKGTGRHPIPIVLLTRLGVDFRT